ncbi:hypothetical protein GWK47_015012 [Chionoecetes opilio]|uniref:Uncharacterized protein n=1 Tax=Chionoecetes opilio TaxID=41210 RepID=A0A8J4XTS3_CHIOP|nr:hypothetical protein GWK47_015012 [Chionoecetes opilio]
MWVFRAACVVVVVVVVGEALAEPDSQGWPFYNNLRNSLGLGTPGNNNHGHNNNNNKQDYITNTNNYNNRNGHTNNDYSVGSNQQASSSSQQIPLDHYYNSATAAQHYYLTQRVTTAPTRRPRTPPMRPRCTPTTWHESGTAAAHGTDSSPALSALALLGFLYFLNLIQDVLQDNSGRRRRSLPAAGIEGRAMEEHKEEEGHYITTYLEEEPVKGGDAIGEEMEEEVTADSQIEPRAFSFLEDFFIKLPLALGMRKRQLVERLSRDKKPMGIASFIASRVKIISSIMSFLQDPSPTRIRRGVQDAESDESVEGKALSESYQSPSLGSLVPLMLEVLKGSSPVGAWAGGRGSGSSMASRAIPEAVAVEDARRRVARRPRHSATSMNAWYGEMGGRNNEPNGGVGGVAAKSDVVQETAKQEAIPALLELSQGLGGSSPHCLQRVLCRLTSHASQLSLLPRLALQMLSSNFVGESKDAMKAGLRGENCSQTFSECDAGNSLG